MTFRPCPSCRRHVKDAGCPFCGATMPAVVAPAPIRGGRLSRAAIFAGATLAGCVVAPPPQQPPPPPDDQHQRHPLDHAVEPPPPPPPPDQSFAKPPASTGGITGVVTGDSTGGPIGGIVVHAQRGGDPPLTARTDGNGGYAFHDLPAGTYTVTAQAQSNHPRRGPPPPSQVQVQVADGAVTRVDVTVVIYSVPVDRGPCCKPYGAPPARRRVV